MEQLFEFLLGHWALSVSLLIILALIIRLELKSTLGGVLLSPTDVVRKINRESALVLDVRQADQFANGHIVNAMHFPPDEMDKRVKKLNKFKDKPLILVCENGQSSHKLVKKLKQQGFDQVFVLKQGLTAWKEAQMPLTKSV